MVRASDGGDAGLDPAGFRVENGLDTSPHLIRLNERIRVNGQEISDDQFASLHSEVDRVAEGLVGRSELPWHPSFFEMMTAIAFEYFARERVDLAVLEVGMGGRLDATNVVDRESERDYRYRARSSEVSWEYRGRDCAGEGRNYSSRWCSGDATTAARGERRDREYDPGAGGAAVNAVPYVPPISPGSTQYLVPSTEKDEPGFVYRYPLAVLGEETRVETPLVGRHQLRNVALAIAAAVELSQQGFSSITAESIERGIRETRWPGRFQVIAARTGWPEIVLDVAHNPAGAWALRSALSERYGDRPLIFVFAAMRDKAISEMIEILFPLAERVVATRAENPRSATPEEIQQAAARTGVGD